MSEITELVVHELARDTIRECHEHAASVQTAWSQVASRLSGDPLKDANKWATETPKSWSQQLSLLFVNNFDDRQEVFKDGDLSLFVRSSLVFGIIFHRAHRPPVPQESDIRLVPDTKMMGRYCGHNLYPESYDGLSGADLCVLPLGSATRGAISAPDECPKHGAPETVFALPIPGTWSFHS